jgi:hypothetical protein
MPPSETDLRQQRFDSAAESIETVLGPDETPEARRFALAHTLHLVAETPDFADELTKRCGLDR